MRIGKALVALLVVAVALVAVVPAVAEPGTAVTWLKQQQRSDGGFGSQGSTLSETAEVVYALAAAGTDFSQVTNSGKSAIDYLTANVAQATSTGAQAKVALALIYAGGDASALLAQIEGSLNSEGMYGGAEDSLASHLYAMLALAAGGRTVPQQAVTWLESHQATNGGWAWNGSDVAEDVDTNTTALALQALAATGVKSDAAVSGAVDYLRAMQNDDGGFPYQKPSPYGTDTDANSTAVVIQGLLAIGQDLPAWAMASGGTPLAALASLQRNDGPFAWQAAFPDANLLATAQAIPALLGKAHPLVVKAVAAATTTAPTTAATAATEAATAAATEVTAAATETAGALLPTTGGTAMPAQALVLAGLGLLAAGFVVRRRLAA
ncbi:MAG: prenyltransferase/squalene oxidase repeat-containing protein [Anaerolineae bacterium]